jgi:hypothetical protein
MSLRKKTAAEVQDLTWALADDAISPDNVKRLEDLLMADPEARKLYVQCMQMQADLHLFFNPEKSMAPALETATKSPVLTALPTGKSSAVTKPTHSG